MSFSLAESVCCQDPEIRRPRAIFVSEALGATVKAIIMGVINLEPKLPTLGGQILGEIRE